jgi:hypothetical protein
MFQTVLKRSSIYLKIKKPTGYLIEIARDQRIHGMSKQSLYPENSAVPKRYPSSAIKIPPV